MANEERILKVLAGLYQVRSRGNERGVTRSDINSGISSLNFNAHNEHQMGQDLEYLESRELLVITPDGNKIRYIITEKGAKIAKNIINVWSMLRSE